MIQQIQKTFTKWIEIEKNVTKFDLENHCKSDWKYDGNGENLNESR